MIKASWSKILLLVCFACSNFPIYSQCTIEESIAIPDLQPVSANLIVSGAVNNDLSTAQGVCGISLEFNHDQVGDLTIALTSPAGQTVTLIGPTGSFGNTSFTDWNVLFVPCGDVASPDAGFADIWNNDQSWGVLGDYSGSYFPYLGCLEDFNIGSVDGIWNIEILDNTMFDLGTLVNATIFFCDPTGLSCNLCEADAGVFTVETLNVCASDPANITLEPSYPNGVPTSLYDFYYVVRQGETILDITQNLDLTGYMEGTYSVCAFSLSVDDNSELSNLAALSYTNFVDAVDGANPSVCGAVNQECVELILAQAPSEIDLDVTICDGDSYEIGMDSYSVAGMYEVTIPQSNGCDSIFNLDLKTSNIQAVVNAQTTILDCVDNQLTLDGGLSMTTTSSIYQWSTSGGGIVGSTTMETAEVNQPGTYTLTIIDGLCQSTSTIQIFANDDAPEITLTGGTITCTNPEVNIDLETTATLTTVTWSGPNNFSAGTQDISVSFPGIYTVDVVADNGCKASKSISINQAGDVPILSLSAAEITCSNPQVTILVNASSNSIDYSWTGPNSFSFEGKNPIVELAGIYYVTATDDFGCIGQYSIEIIGNSDILEYDLEYTDIVCVGGASILTLDINDANAIIEWTSPSGGKNYGPIVSVSEPGNYTVNVISNGCQAEEQFSLVEDYSGLPTASIVQENTIDCNNASTWLYSNIVDDAGNLNYISWFVNGQYIGGDMDILASITGNYRLWIYTIDGCSTSYDHFLEFDVAVPTAVLVSENITCKNPDASIIVTANEILDYSWSGPGAFTSQDSAITNLGPGFYILTITDADGCQRVYNNNIVVDTIPYVLNMTAQNQLNCLFDSTLISPTFFGITDISWTSTTGFLSNDISIKVDEPGFYYIEAEGIGNGCITRDTVEVIEDLVIPDLVTGDQSFDCGQSSILLEASSTTANVKYDWTGPNSFTATIANPLIFEPGTYNLLVTGTNGCTTERVVNVTSNNTLPNVGASYSQDLDCINTQSDIIGTSTTNNVSFVWKGPNGFFAGDPVVTIDVAGDYTFLVTGLNGCTDSITINVPFTGEYPVFDALGDTLFCGENQTTIDVQSTTANVDYMWTGPNSFNSVLEMNMVVDSGMYILTGVGTNSCVSRDTAYVVFDNQPATVSIDYELDTLDCNVLLEDIIITSDKSFASTTWTGPNAFEANTKDIQVDEGGLYVFTGISENNCEVIFNIDVEQDIAKPQALFAPEEINCDNNKSEILVTNNDIDAVYSWEGPDFFSSNLQSPTVENGGDYQLTLTGSNGCILDTIITVLSDLEKPDLTAIDDTLPCDGAPIELFAFSNMDDVVFSWIGPNGFDSIGADPIAVFPGTYFIEATGPNGCSSNTSIEVSDVPVLPVFEIGKPNDINCEFESVVLTALDVADDKEFLWSGPEDFSSSDPSFETMKDGMYYLEVTGITGCIEIDSVEVSIDTLAPDVLIVQEGMILCDVNEISVSGEGSSQGIQYKYEWFSDDGIISFGANSLNPIIQGEGTYRLVITNEISGCVNHEDILIEEEKSTLAAVDLTYKIQTCTDINDGEITIENVQGGVLPYRYAIEGTSFSEINTFEALESGEHLVSIKDSFGCVLDTIVNLQAKKSINVDLGEDIPVNLGESVNLVAQIDFPSNQIDSIAWHPTEIIDCGDCLQYEFVPDENTLVTILIKDFDGCITTDQVVIRVDESVNLYIPNIFTPNGDGINDIFELSSSTNIEEITYFNVYDRWGSKVFADTEFVPGTGKVWDGRHLGQSVKQGVYFYLAELKMVNGKTQLIKGNITIAK